MGILPVGKNRIPNRKIFVRLDSTTDCPQCLDLVLFPLFCPAFPIAPSNRICDSEIIRSLRHIHVNQGHVAQRDFSMRTCWHASKRTDHSACDRPSEWRRNGVPNLPSPMPFRCMKTKPVRKAMQPRHFSHSHATRQGKMNRARTGEGAARGIRSGTQRIADSRSIQLEEPRNRFDMSGRRFAEPPAGNIAVFGSSTRCQCGSIPLPDIAIMPCVVR